MENFKTIMELNITTKDSFHETWNFCEIEERENNGKWVWDDN